MRIARFTIGRWLVHLGLRVMPPGRARRELDELFRTWGIRVVEIVDYLNRRRAS